jgi:hypothetical protein
MDKQHAVDPSREYSAEVTGVEGKNGYRYDKTAELVNVNETVGFMN